MTSTTPTRIIAIALAALAMTAPVAGAMPTADTATTAPAPKQDLRNPDQQAPAPKPYQDLRNPDNRVPGVPSDLPTTMKPVHLAPPAVEDSAPSPLVFVLPALALVAMLGAAVIYTRSSRRPARV